MGGESHEEGGIEMKTTICFGFFFPSAAKRIDGVLLVGTISAVLVEGAWHSPDTESAKINKMLVNLAVK